MNSCNANATLKDFKIIQDTGTSWLEDKFFTDEYLTRYWIHKSNQCAKLTNGTTQSVWIPRHHCILSFPSCHSPMPESTVFLLEALKMHYPMILCGNADEMQHLYTAVPVFVSDCRAGVPVPYCRCLTLRWTSLNTVDRKRQTKNQHLSKTSHMASKHIFFFSTVFLQQILKWSISTEDQVQCWQLGSLVQLFPL